MYTPKYKKIVNILLHIPLILLLYILQATIFSRIPLWGVKPLILPIGAAAIALCEGTTRGGAFGLVLGVLCDLSLNQSPAMFTVGLTLVGLLVGSLSDAVLEDRLPSILFTALFVLVLCSLGQAVPLFLGQKVPALPLLFTAGKQTLYSAVFIIPVYYLVRFTAHTPSL